MISRFAVPSPHTCMQPNLYVKSVQLARLQRTIFSPTTDLNLAIYELVRANQAILRLLSLSHSGSCVIPKVLANLCRTKVVTPNGYCFMHKSSGWSTPSLHSFTQPIFCTYILIRPTINVHATRLARKSIVLSLQPKTGTKKMTFRMVGNSN